MYIYRIIEAISKRLNLWLSQKQLPWIHCHIKLIECKGNSDLFEFFRNIQREKRSDIVILCARTKLDPTDKN